MTFAALMNLSDDKIPWLRRSKIFAAAIKPLLDALVIDDQMFLRLGHCPALYRSKVRYQEEPPTIVTTSDGRTITVEEFAAAGIVFARGWGDCFPEGTLVLRNDYSTVPIETLEPGDQIWGHKSWVSVEACAEKGTKTLDAVHMNNGSTMMLTPEHDVLVMTCPRHPNTWDWRSSKHVPCNCPESGPVKMKVAELEPSMILAQPERLPFGSETPNIDLTHVEGLYLSDGWSDRTRFGISGQDGCPKEEQKKLVQKICNEHGIHTRWHRKYLAVNDRDWTLRMMAMGSHAPEKRALSLNLGEAAAQALLAGIMADSGKNASTGRTFTTTSRVLCTQTRILHRMFGRDCSFRFVENHGGLGKNPIYRLGVREPISKSGKLLRVKEISRGISEAPCYDIQTTDNTVYLPEHDVTVAQCDDLSPLRCAELRNQGERATIRIQWKQQPSGQKLYHILVRRQPGATWTDRRLNGRVVKLPRDFDPRFMVLAPDGSVIEDPNIALGMPASMSTMRKDVFLTS